MRDATGDETRPGRDDEMCNAHETTGKRPVRYDVNHDKAVTVIPMSVSKRASKISWSIVSMVADRSKEVTSLLSSEERISLSILTTAVSAEW